MTTLSPATISALQTLASESALTPSAKSSHFENLHQTLLSFLTGVQPLTEADALLLTRARFTPPAKPSALLRLKAALSFKTLHPAFPRELSTHALALLWSLSLTYVLTALVYIPAIMFPAARTAIRHQTNLATWPSIVIAALLWLTFFTLYVTLRRKRPSHFSPASPRFWQRTLLSLATALALPLAAIHLFNLLFGAWSVGKYPEGLLLYLLPNDPLWIRAGGSHLADVLMLALWALGTTALLLYFLNTTKENSLLPRTLALAAFLATLLFLRLVINAAIFHARWSHGLFGNYLQPTLTHTLFEFTVFFSLHSLGILLLTLLITTTQFLLRRRSLLPN